MAVRIIQISVIYFVIEVGLGLYSVNGPNRYCKPGAYSCQLIGLDVINAGRSYILSLSVACFY